MSQPEIFENHWYYQDNGRIRGPFKKEAMIVSIMDHEIGPDTQVWNTSWSDATPAKPLRDTSFSDYLTDEARKKYTPKPVSDRLAWVLALFPVAFLFIDSILIYNYSPIAFSNFYIFGVPMVYSLIALVDALRIRDSGRGKAPLYWFWITPVYLAVRASKLKRGVRFFWLWLASSLLYAIVVFGVVDGGYLLPSLRPLPSCSSSMVIDTNKQIFDDAMRENRSSYASMARSLQNALGAKYGSPYHYNEYSGFGQNMKAEELANIQQVTNTSDVRSCQAVVITSLGPRIPIAYSIKRASGGIEVKLRSR
ncbi:MULTISPECIES: DUF4339 domain-containing protein [unclassified Modicisalibacter]|uniref:DUF4339 domain-containing protein n=1 Tax=unclassified Modicisalibacter TaxID=2679913 RepID=UPI001CC9ED3F|nr:DUF4339 domain-containing protein [Modicisalibacter sp. R2A 31.J]MBZ9573484.1 DUF4339 domain-containing protein [Modicisalibacter sp. MOD 31.J]